MKKFKKLILYDLKAKPLQREFIVKLKRYSDEVKIIYANAEYEKALKLIHLKDADALVTRLFDNYDQITFEKSILKYVGAMHTDVSHFDKRILRKNGITLTNVAGYATEAVAELTLSALLNITRQTHDAMIFVKKGRWGFETFLGTELKNKTIGIVGLGNIGTRVAELAQCFGMRVQYFSRTRKKHLEKAGLKYLSLGKLLKSSDVVSLHCNLTDRTTGLLNKARLKLMKDGSILLNPSRSELVDLKALYDLTRSGKIRVWFEAIEDKKIRDKFRKLDNVYLTPHFGWMTREAQIRLMEMTLRNIEKYLSGRQ